MDLNPKEISIDSHNHGTLKLKPAQKPYQCGGCKEPEFDLQPCYQCLKCDFHLHKECVPSPYPFYLGLIGCDLTFQPDPRGNIITCDACGKHVRGSFYQGLISRGKPRYLHPCCAKLPFKRTDNGGVVLDLKEKTSLVCLICGNQGHSRDFKSWAYVPRSGSGADYCYHVSCVKGKVETWKTTKEGSIQRRSYVASGAAGTSSGAPAPGRQGQGAIIKPWRGEKVLDFLETAVEIFNIVVSLLFGLPPLPFSLVVNWLRKKK